MAVCTSVVVACVAAECTPVEVAFAAAAECALLAAERISAGERRYRVHMPARAPVAMSLAQPLWATALPPLATLPVPQDST
jgi:hypothetical protein